MTVYEARKDPVYNIHSRDHIDDLVQVTILRGLFNTEEEAMLDAKGFAKMVICAGVGIDTIWKCPVPDVPKAYYKLVEAFYYSLLREGKPAL